MDMSLNFIAQRVPARIQGYASQPPLHQFLERCHAQFKNDHSGVVADYIPELQRANPDHFGISIATIDGHVYEVGDSAVPFTIQSVSKAFVFALALELLGAEQVEASIGVEPSGEAFNSIRLTADNRPFNPMVNAGAIACSGLILSAKGSDAFETIRAMLSRFAGHSLDVDEAVYASERDTGDRNRAIGWLLRNYSVLEGNVDEVLDIYFRQCAVLVTARDLAIMAATLANRGVNPITGDQVVKPYVVARTLSVMTSSGMYDYAGEWTYRVGIPAKSGVGGGIAAALPSQMGLGTFSPRLDSHGNSARGLSICEALSSRFDLHVLNRSADVRTCIIADYDISHTSSRRIRQAHEQDLLEYHHKEVRIIELVGSLNFANVDYIARRLAWEPPNSPLLILDFRRVPDITTAGSRLLGENLADLAGRGIVAVLSGFTKNSSLWREFAHWADDVPKLHIFEALDNAVEWAEDQVIYRFGGFVESVNSASLNDQALLAGLTAEQIGEIRRSSIVRRYNAGQRIVSANEPANSFYFVERGMVSVKLPSGVRLASLGAGMVFGEMAIIESVRSADVWADNVTQCLELPLSEFSAFRLKYPDGGHCMMANLATLLSRRLILANAKVDLLSAY
jgi:glutaminase